eukprot:746612-Hanusia_phi.AAC.2
MTDEEDEMTILSDDHHFRVDESEMRLMADEKDVESFRAAGVPLDRHGNPMRPAVLMFDDEPEHLLKTLRAEQDKYQQWEVWMSREIHVGMRRRSVRYQGAVPALLIRINPEYPYNQMNPHLTLPVQGSALASLTEIDDHVMALLQEHNMGSSAEVQ